MLTNATLKPPSNDPVGSAALEEPAEHKMCKSFKLTIHHDLPSIQLPA